MAHPPHRRPLDRRLWLQRVLFGSGLLGLRSLACGVPRQVLASPVDFLRRTSDEQARTLVAAGASMQFLILSGSDDGDPLNGNAPGTYDDKRILHSTLPSMAATKFNLGGTAVTGAKVYATLPSEVLAQTCFFHGRTNLIGHGEFNTAHLLNHTIADDDVLASTIAKKTAPVLATVQPQPLNVSRRGGTESISYNGAPQPTFSPTGLRQLLQAPAATDLFGKSLALRDRDLDAINAIFAARATPAQKQLLDSWATSQAQARNVSADIVAQLQGVQDDGVDSQLLVSLLLFRLKITPVTFVHLPFGGDNHVDNNGEIGPGPLNTEVAQTGTTVASIAKFYASATSLGLGGKVTLATMNTFGRGNAWNLAGRAHNQQHVVNVLVGANVRGSLVGGVSIDSGDLQGVDFDAVSGLPAPGGDVAAVDSLPAYGKTVARAVGIDAASVDQMITAGKAVEAALTKA